MRLPRESDPDLAAPTLRLGAGAPEAEVRELFDGMAGAYDDLRDLWYGYLFDRLHQFLERRYRVRAPALSVLDVGCGTGQQSLPFAGWGSRVAALDLALQPLRIAARKARGGGSPLALAQASAVELPFASGAFDLVVSCGSVISFIPDYDAALAEMRRVLRPGGEIALEFEHRWSLDLLWPLVDGLADGALRYRQPLSRTLRNLFASTHGPVPIEYPFIRPDGVEVIFNLWLFGAGAIDRVLARHGFERLERHTIHSVTNLLPSTVLNTPTPSGLVSRLFASLARIEDRVRDLPPFNRIGNSMFVVARRR
jgi:ubiquinone/menaquinone biosynthesis C-methylase UbiE